jgi:hypothetical protein
MRTDSEDEFSDIPKALGSIGLSSVALPYAIVDMVAKF